MSSIEDKIKKFSSKEKKEFLNSAWLVSSIVSGLMVAVAVFQDGVFNAEKMVIVLASSLAISMIVRIYFKSLIKRSGK